MKPLLQSLYVRNFRGLNSVSFENLGRVNLLVGENNSGKTSALEALMLFLRPGDRDLWISLLGARDIGNAREDRSRIARWLFPIVGRGDPPEHAAIELEGVFQDNRASLRAVYLRPIIRPGSAPEDREPNSDPDIFIDWFSERTGRRSGKVRLSPVWPHDQSRRAAIAHPELDAEIRSIPKYPLELVKPHAHRTTMSSTKAFFDAFWQGHEKELLGFLQQFDTEILGVYYDDKGRWGTRNYITHRRLGVVPLYAFGDGVRKAVVTIDRLIRAKGGVLLLDEAETALHVHAQDTFFSQLLSLCEEFDVQLFLTTHSLDAVDSVLRAAGTQKDAVVGYHLNNDNGSRSVKRFSGDMLERLRFERGLDIR